MYNANDITDEGLECLIERSSNKDLLLDLVDISRKRFGFFTKHTPRAFEYVWMLENLDNKQNMTTLDVGAGLNPIPFYLAALNCDVYTIDYSTFIRDVTGDKEDWNEWGFYNYNEVNPSIHSFNVDINQHDFDREQFDVIYSISVIEHMPAEERRQLIERLSKWLKPKGQLLLTVDLYKGKHDLWNYNYGVVVEETDVHGTLDDFFNELGSYFNLESYEIVTDSPNINHIDIAALKLSKK